MKRDQFTFYRSYYEAIKVLPQKEQIQVLLSLCAYALDETEPSLSGVSLSVFTLMRPTVDKGRKKAENRLSKMESNAGQEQNKSKTNQEQNRNEGEIEKESEIEVECEGEVERELESECECEYTPYIPPLPRQETNAEQDDGFDAFWAAYPVKSGIIEQAYREYLQAIREATPEQIMGGLLRQKPIWAEQGARYTPSAEKWLHNKGWTAEQAQKPDRLAWIDGVAL